MSNKVVLLTGGLGYIGSHIAVELAMKGFDIVILDNLYNSSEKTISNIEKIVRRKITFIKGDIRDKAKLEDLFLRYNFEVVIHLAGLKAVGESVDHPLTYFDNNISGSVCLFQTMHKYKVKKIIFSSTATVYGSSNKIPYTEEMPVGNTTKPYSRSKLIIENILRDLALSDKEWSVVNLRYFNPVGAHYSGLIGENPKGRPNNLMPIITQVAIGKIPKVEVYGNDYITIDGTGVRDYIHVVDLAKGHVDALMYSIKNQGEISINLGTGSGVSVLQLIKKFEEINNLSIPFSIHPRRKGDIDQFFADASLARKILNWEAKLSLGDMCRDSWNFQKKNLSG